jgi:hypothetical protein
MGMNAGLDGMHSLTSWAIDLKVRQHSGGAYALGITLLPNGEIPIKYVGRADYDLNNRLKQHASEGRYKYFAFIYCGSVIAAYDKDCELYHTFGNLDNTVHPAKPNASCKCPQCGT